MCLLIILKDENSVICVNTYPRNPTGFLQFCFDLRKLEKIVDGNAIFLCAVFFSVEGLHFLRSKLSCSMHYTRFMAYILQKV